MPADEDSRKSFLASVVADYFNLSSDGVAASCVRAQAVNEFLDSGNSLALIGRLSNGKVVFSSAVSEWQTESCSFLKLIYLFVIMLCITCSFLTKLNYDLPFTGSFGLLRVQIIF